VSAVDQEPGPEDGGGPEPAAETRQGRQQARQRAITEAVMAAGTIRIEQLAERFDISVMTVHRDLDELEARGLLRKSRGIATATSTLLVESSDVYRAGRQRREKQALATAAMEYLEPGQAVLLDDSTTVHQMARHLPSKSPITVITNALPLLDALRVAHGVTLLGLGGQYYNWCSAFMGSMTTRMIASLRADVLVMSTAAITDDVVFHQALETVDVKRAMLDAAGTRILLADHTKFERRALHALVPLTEFDVVIVDEETPEHHVDRMRRSGVEVVVAGRSGGESHTEEEDQA
jgi:DeoR/GlpR family transcriptional regulator of sugar metabolism